MIFFRLSIEITIFVLFIMRILEANHLMRKREVFIEEVEIDKRIEIPQWNQWPEGQNKSLGNYKQVPKCRKEDRQSGYIFF